MPPAARWAFPSSWPRPPNCWLIRSAQVRVMDMLQVGESYFFGVVAMGIPGEVAVMADREAKDRLGNLAYAVSAIRATVRAPNSDYTITLDGQEIHSHGVICVILNQSAGLMHFKPPVDGADGLLDVAIFRDESLRTVAKAAGNVLLRNENLVPVEHWQGREVTVVSQPAQADAGRWRSFAGGQRHGADSARVPCGLWCRVVHPAQMPKRRRVLRAVCWTVDLLWWPTLESTRIDVMSQQHIHHVLI